MAQPKQPTLVTARLVLRPFLASDAADVQRLAGAREIADTTLTIPHPYADGLAETWIASHREAFEAGKVVSYAVTERGSGELVGCTSLKIEAANAVGELGYWIGVPFWGRGYAPEAAACLIKFAVTRFSLHRIQAHHLVRNPGSGRVMQKLGMVYEGTLREAVRKSGRFEDVAVYSLLASELGA